MTPTPLIPVDYTPWGMQRLVHRSTAAIRVVVAARQTGKTVLAAREVVSVMMRRPGSHSCLLMPTRKSTTGPMKQLRQTFISALGKEEGLWKWRAQEGTFTLWNGAALFIRTCDNDAKAGVPTRGLTLDGILWVDEGAYVPRSSWDAARLTQAAVKDPLCIITTTPCGKNWVYDEWLAGVPGPQKNPFNESFRFRASQSPYINAKFIEDMKRKLGVKRALQELEAVFLGDGGSVFNQEDIEALLSPSPLVKRGTQRSLGLDLAKERDFTVCTMMNEFGESWVLWRVRQVEWPDIEKKITKTAQEHHALVVLDIGHGGGYGGTMHDYLVRSLGKGRVLPIRTGNRGVKAQMVETLQADMQNRRLRLDAGDHFEETRLELTFFEGKRLMVGGTEIWVYAGPKSEKAGDSATGEGEDHDDVVMSLGLANWGRVYGWTKKDVLAGDYTDFQPASAGRASAAETSSAGFGEWSPATDGIE